MQLFHVSDFIGVPINNIIVYPCVYQCSYKKQKYQVHDMEYNKHAVLSRLHNLELIYTV